MQLSYRIAVTQYDTDAQFTRLLALLQAHRPAVDEISLFTEYWHHVYFPLEAFAERAALMGRRCAELKAAGIPSVGFNLLDTLGHLNEAWDYLPPLPFQSIVGHDGSVSRSCACPLQPDYRIYIAEKYRLIAVQQPDFIWVDDDIRLHHHGVAWGCFCGTCVQAFHERTGLPAVDRPTLLAHLHAEDGGAWRQAWVANTITVLDELLAHVAGAIRAVDAGIAIGQMSTGPGWTTYSGQALARWQRTLGGDRVRPGGGFYEDSAPRAMLTKAFDVGRQVLSLDGTATNIQYEIEDFPYQTLDKSVRSILNECTLSLMVGCNGVAFNILKDLSGSLEDYTGYFNGIEAERPMWERLVAETEGLPPAGFWPAASDALMARRSVTSGNWFDWNEHYNIDKPLCCADIGLPLTTDPAAACGILLPGRVAEAFDDDELRRYLAGGVMLDPVALELLWERGLGELTGVRPGRAHDNGVFERFTTHPLNGVYADDARDVRVSFWPVPAQELDPVADGVISLAHLVGYDDSVLGSTLSLYENALGGRVAVLGYGPWTKLSSSAKRTQMLNIADWVTNMRVPLRVERTLRVTPLVRQDARRKLVALLLNTSYDATGSFSVELRQAYGTVRLLTAAGDASLPSTVADGKTRVELPSLSSWYTHLLVATA